MGGGGKDWETAVSLSSFTALRKTTLPHDPHCSPDSFSGTVVLPLPELKGPGDISC